MRGVRIIAVTFASALALALLVFSASARAETLSVFCSWPNHLDDKIVEVNLDNSTVRFWGERSRDVFGPLPARITEHEIAWDYWWKNGGDHIFATINRISGQLRFCDKDTCWDPYECQRSDTVKPKF